MLLAHPFSCCLQVGEEEMTPLLTMARTESASTAKGHGQGAWDHSSPFITRAQLGGPRLRRALLLVEGDLRLAGSRAV